MAKPIKRRRLADAYTSPGFRRPQRVHGMFDDPSARLVTLIRRGEKPICGTCGTPQLGWYGRRRRRIPASSCADHRIYLNSEVRRIVCRQCGAVSSSGWIPSRERERAAHKRFALYVGWRCRSGTIYDSVHHLKEFFAPLWNFNREGWVRGSLRTCERAWSGRGESTGRARRNTSCGSSRYDVARDWIVN